LVCSLFLMKMQNEKSLLSRKIARETADALRSAVSHGQLSEAAAAYAFTLKNPFDGPVAGIPSEYPPVPSLKMRVWTRGTFYTSSTGFGFVAVNPWNMAANDVIAAYSSQTGFVGSSITLGAGTYSTYSNSPFADASITGNGALYRVVSAGLRVTPTMAQVDIAGQMTVLRHPDNGSLATFGESDMQAFETALYEPIRSSRDATGVVYLPVNPNETDYLSSTSTNSSEWCLGAIVTGSSSKSFFFEASAVIEFCGKTVRGKTYSTADPEGFSAVLTAVNLPGGETASSKNWAESAVNLIRSATSVLSEMSTPVLKWAGPAALRTAANALRNGRMPGLIDVARAAFETHEVSASGPLIEDVSVDDLGMDESMRAWSATESSREENSDLQSFLLTCKKIPARFRKPSDTIGHGMLVGGSIVSFKGRSYPSQLYSHEENSDILYCISELDDGFKSQFAVLHIGSLSPLTADRLIFSGDYEHSYYVLAGLGFLYPRSVQARKRV